MGKISEAEGFLLNKDYLQASLLANAIIPNNMAEAITRRFIIIYCRWIMNTGTNLTSDEIYQLQQIAALCPAQYGDAVTMARTLLKVTIEDFTEYADNCEQSNSNSRLAHFINSKNIVKDIQTIISVIPNPAKEFITVKLPANSAAQIIIYDILGVSILDQKTHSSNNRIDISQISQGIYFFKIKLNNGGTSEGKLTIIK